jgi:hypothetical protein
MSRVLQPYNGTARQTTITAGEYMRVTAQRLGGMPQLMMLHYLAQERSARQVMIGLAALDATQRVELLRIIKRMGAKAATAPREKGKPARGRAAVNT